MTPQATANLWGLMFRTLKAISLFFLLICPNLFASVTFDRTDDYMNPGTMGNFGTGLDTNYLIVSMWIKSSTTANSMCVLGTFNTGTVTAYQLVLNLSPADGTTVSAGKIYSQRRDDSGETYSGGVNSNTGITDGSWHHLLVSHKNNSLAIWVDGTSKTITTLGVQNADVMSNFSFALTEGGRNNRGTIDVLFGGDLDEIAVGSSTSTPTAQEVATLASSRGKRIPLQFPNLFNGFFHALDSQPDGTSFDGDVDPDLTGHGNGSTGVDGANNTGLTSSAESRFSYP